MKKIFGAIVSVAAVLSAAFALSACSDGGHTKHEFTAWVTTDPEYHWHVCATEGCDETDEKVAHNWVADESKTDVPATCISDGIHYLKCECGAKKSETITTRPDHDFSGAWITTDPDYHYHVCTTEGCDEKDEKVPHTWVDDADKTDVPATCIADGEHYLKCACGAEKSEAITTRPGHNFTGALVNTDGTGHYHVCTTEGCDETDEKVAHVCAQFEKIDDNVHSKTCECGYSENEAHTWDGGVVTKEPSETEKGIRTYTCGICHGTKTEAIPETSHEHAPGADWVNDENSHWHTCTGCSEKLDEANHTWVADESKTDVPATCHSDGIHYIKCSVCGKEKSETLTDRPGHNFTGEWVKTDHDYHWHVCTNDGCDAIDEKIAHNWNDGEETKKPTFWETGETTYTCGECGQTKTEAIERLQTADFAEEFSMKSNPNGSWSYGKVDYIWDTDNNEANGKQEDLTFTKATDKNDGGDGWVIGGCEIKNGFINSDNWATVAFTFTEDTAATVNFKFTGNKTDSGEDNLFNCRIGVKDEDGKIYSNPTYIGGIDGGLHVCESNAEYHFNAGDTIYFMIEHTGGWASGTLELTITRNAANAE